METVVFKKCNPFALLIRVSETLKANVEISLFSEHYGQLTHVNLYERLDIKLGKERQCHISTKQLVHSSLVNFRISQPSKVMFTSASPR